jgi:biopolymer transport protein ExbD
MAMRFGNDDGTPMMDLNTTPLIDVMLVLLIMLMLTIPPISHAVSIDLPGGPQTQVEHPKPVMNKIVILPGNEIRWNGTPVSIDQMAQYLAQTRSMTPEPELQLQPAPDARYDVVDRVMATVKRSGVGGFGFVGNEQYRLFGKSGQVGL